jgi:adenosylcobinamide-GDP ribazoletransferase
VNAKATLRGVGADLLAAIQFLTRIPVSAPHAPDALAQAAKFFPLVGLIVGACAAGLNMLLAPHLPRLVTATLLVVFLVLITGCLHEDGLADAADALGGGWTREQILIILKDSRIGSYGAAALTLSLVARVVLLASLQANQVAWYLIVSQVLCRWSTLPLSAFLPSARPAVDGGTPGQGARIARLISPGTLVFGSLFSFAVAAIALKMHAIVVIVGAMLLTLLSGVYYKRRTGGVTGDFFGATNQLTEIFVYLTGVWIR